MSNSYTEDHLVEHPAIQLMRDELGWEVEENLGARRSGNGLWGDATATLCWTTGSICALRDSIFPGIWNP